MMTTQTKTREMTRGMKTLKATPPMPTVATNNTDLDSLIDYRPL
jgi:hypothetical protein